MEKILVALNARQVNINVIDFACYIAKLSGSELSGIFLENKPVETLPAGRPEIGQHRGEKVAEPAVAETRCRVKLSEDYIEYFEEACQKRGVRSSVHIDKSVPVKEIIMESRFADLLIVDPEMSFGKRNGRVPTLFITGVLAKSECPVVIAPFTFNSIDEILLVNDNTSSSAFAIKQFTYLFPELTDNRITVAGIVNSGELAVNEKKLLGGFLQMHYSSIGFRVLEGSSGDELLSYLIDKKNIFVVMGGCDCDKVSGLFRGSSSELLLRTVNLPIFVTPQQNDRQFLDSDD